METIKEEAVTTVDKSIIGLLFSHLRLSSQNSAGTNFPLRTAAHFGASIDRVLAAGDTDLVIYIDPSRLRFATNLPDIRNFAEIQLDREFTNRNPNGTFKTAQAPSPAPAPAPGFAPAGGIAPVAGSTHACTTTQFNVNALPPVVKKRYSDHADLDKILSKSDIKNFSKVGSCKDPADPSKFIKVDQLHYIDGESRLIARNVAYFDLNSQ